MSEGLGLTPDEEAQLGEILNFDNTKIQEFLQTFFPDQHAKSQEDKLKAGLGDEPVQYTILAEDDLCVEFSVGGIKVRMEREPFKRGPGRPRQNPWIDQRMMDRLSDTAVRAACYAVAAYKLGKEGNEFPIGVERDILAEIRKNLFKGEVGLLALSHVTGVAMDAMAAHRANPIPSGITLDGIVLQALIRAIALPVGRELEREA